MRLRDGLGRVREPDWLAGTATSSLRSVCRARLSEPPQRGLALSRSAPGWNSTRCFRHGAMRVLPERNRALNSAESGFRNAYRLVLVDGRFAPELSRVEGLPAGRLARCHGGGDRGATGSGTSPRSKRRRNTSSRLPRSTPRFSPTASSSMSRRASTSIGRSRSSTWHRASGRLAAHAQPRCGRRRQPRVRSSRPIAGSGSYWRNDVVELRLAEDAELAQGRAHRGSGGGPASRRDADAVLEPRLAARQLYPVAGRPDDTRTRPRSRARARRRIAGSRRVCRCPGARRRTSSPRSTTGAGRRDSRSVQGVAAGRAHGAFQGRIIVRPGAQKIDAHQLSRNLMLGRARRDRHQARTRNLRRRRQVQPRRHGRRSRRGGAVLPARPRHSGRGGAADADRGVCCARRSSGRADPALREHLLVAARPRLAMLEE